MFVRRAVRIAVVLFVAFGPYLVSVYVFRNPFRLEPQYLLLVVAVGAVLAGLFWGCVMVFLAVWDWVCDRFLRLRS